MPNIVKSFFDVKKGSYYMFSSVEAFHNGLGQSKEVVISRLSSSLIAFTLRKFLCSVILIKRTKQVTEIDEEHYLNLAKSVIDYLSDIICKLT